MLDQITHFSLVFSLNFLNIFFSLALWSLIIWVILSWLILFRAMRPDNPGFHLFTQVVLPIIKPFRWARIGMIDFSPLVAILVINFLSQHINEAIIHFL